MYVGYLFIGMVAGAGGINGCIALWLTKDFEAGSNELRNNFRTFLIITIIVNTFVSTKWSMLWKKHELGVLTYDKTHIISIFVIYELNFCL